MSASKGTDRWTPWAGRSRHLHFILSGERGGKFISFGDPQRPTGSYSPPSRGRWADTGSSRARERTSRARSRGSRGTRIASPQSEVRRRGTGIRRNGTPPPFNRFSADRTWWVLRKMRIRTGSVARVNSTPSFSACYHSRHKPPRDLCRGWFGRKVCPTPTTHKLRL